MIDFSVMKLAYWGIALGVLGGCANTSGVATPKAPAALATTETVAAVGAVGGANHLVTVAMRAYSAKDYAAAADAFGRAYANDPDDSLLFARAQSLRLAGDCDQAVMLYDVFMTQTDDPTYRNAVAQLVDDCTPPQVAARATYPR